MATQDLTRTKQLLSEAGLPAAQIDIFAAPAQHRATQMQKDQNVRMFSDIVGRLETGKTGEDAYRTGFGGGLIDNLAAHPNESKRFKQTDGKTNVTTAAGKHQYLKSTWDELAKKTGVKDFSPASQETNFKQLLQDKGTLDMVANGDFQGAINRLGKTWASFPSSPHPQGKKTWDQTNAIIAEVTGQEQAAPSYSGNARAGGKKPLAISEQNLLTAALTPSPEEQMATAAQNEEAAQRQRADFLAQEQSTQDLEVQASVDGRMKDIDKMFADAFGFDKAFKQADNLPTLYDDKLRKLFDLIVVT
jgi:muramidase (phage lysozyme)